ncbi:MAG: GtrA family protein, partial [Halobaculum sp.]
MTRVSPTTAEGFRVSDGGDGGSAGVTGAVTTATDDSATDSREDPNDTESTAETLLSGARIGQFLSVGVAGSVLETVLLTLIDSVLGYPYLLAKAVGAESSITLMFLLNDRWTFAVSADASMFRRWLRSNSVRFVGVGIAAGIGWVLVTTTGFELIL